MVQKCIEKMKAKMKEFFIKSFAMVKAKRARCGCTCLLTSNIAKLSVYEAIKICVDVHTVWRIIEPKGQSLNKIWFLLL